MQLIASIKNSLPTFVSFWKCIPVISIVIVLFLNINTDDEEDQSQTFDTLSYD